LFRRLSQISIFNSGERSVSASITSSDLESIGLALVKASLGEGVVFSLNKSLEASVRVSIIPAEVVIDDVSATSLVGVEHLNPVNLESRGINSLSDSRLGHLRRCSEDTYNQFPYVFDRPVA
jgi:hypothetical protein